MNAVTFRRHRDRLGLSDSAFAGLFRLSDERTVRRWASGENPVPWSVAAVLILAERHDMTAEDLARVRA